MRKRIRIVMSLLAGMSLLALMSPRDALAVDRVMAHIECPGTLDVKLPYADQLTGDGAAAGNWQLSSRDHRSYSAKGIRRGGQDVYCDYERPAHTPSYQYTVPGTMTGCKPAAVPLTRGLDCVVDNATVRFQCPRRTNTRETFPAKIGSDPPFYPTDEGGYRPLMYAATSIVQRGQLLECTYVLTYPSQTPNLQPHPSRATFHYKVQRTILSCQQPSPLALDCQVRN